MDQNLSFNILLLLHRRKLHSILPESILPPFFYISNSLHGLNGLDIKVPVVLQRLVSLFLELEHRIVDKLFIVKFACGLSPCEFSGVVLSPKVAMAFGPAKSEIFAIISHEHDSVTWVDRS